MLIFGWAEKTPAFVPVELAPCELLGFMLNPRFGKSTNGFEKAKTLMPIELPLVVACGPAELFEDVCEDRFGRSRLVRQPLASEGRSTDHGR